MSMRFKNQNEAKEWLKQTKGNKEQRSKLDANQKWSFNQAHEATNQIIGQYENQECDTDEEVELLHGNRQDLIDYIYFEMQRSEFRPGYWSWQKNVGKRHGYSTKNFVLGAIDYWCEKEGY